LKKLPFEDGITSGVERGSNPIRGFDKIVWNDFERTKCGLQGEGQGARSNPSLSANQVIIEKATL
jgi:hypothetical protein